MIEKNPVYEADEDSFLLQDVITTYLDSLDSFDSFSALDMGCGSGILGLTFAKREIPTTFVDLNTKSLAFTKEQLKTENITNAVVIESDLFTDIKQQTFDCIVFNTPYLPDDEDSKDLALHGGPRGNEVALRFLDSVPSYLKENGVLFLLVSSLGHPEDITTKCEKLGLVSKIISRKKLFFEELLIYKITK